MSDAPPKRRTQQERKAESERAIILAAMNLFASQGYMRTTLNEIGKAAGYTGGLVSHRFGSKEGLLQAVLKHIRTRFLDDQLGSAITMDSAEESLRNYIEIYISEVTVREGRVRALYVIMGEALGAVPEIRKDIAELNEHTRNHLAGIIQRGMASSEFRNDANPDTSALLLMGTLRGVVMQYLADPQAVNVKAVIKSIQDGAVDRLKSLL